MPALDRGRIGNGCQRMSDIVLAVAIGPLAVLPGLPPVDGGQPDQDGLIRKIPEQRLRDGLRENRALLESVKEGGVVIESAFTLMEVAIDAGADDVVPEGDLFEITCEIAAFGCASARCSCCSWPATG